MRAETDTAKLMTFMAELGNRVRGSGRIYFAGGATALLHGWRSTTIDVDLKPDPEPPGLFEALAVLKDELDINVELASRINSFRLCLVGASAVCLSRVTDNSSFFITIRTAKHYRNCNAGTIATFRTRARSCAMG